MRLGTMLGAGTVAAMAGLGAWGIAIAPDRYPDRWDPRVGELVAFVESSRDLRFEHPVHVDFVSPDELRRRVSVDDELPSREERELLEQQAALFRAVGLASGELDLLGDIDTLNEATTAAFYDHADDRIVVPIEDGAEIDLLLEVTLVHELTHALQDQHFDLGRDFASDDGAIAAWTSLVEGDAERIENAYVGTLDDATRERYLELADARAQRADDESSTVNEVLVANRAAPYILGPVWLLRAERSGGSGAIDDLFERAETFDEETYLDPYGFDPERAATKSAPDFPPPTGDGRAIEEGEYGPTALLLTLAAANEPYDALAATRGWDSDAYRAVDEDGLVCVTVDVRADSERDLDQLESALARWAGAGPPEARRTASRGSGRVVFHGCDPGPEVDIPVVGDGIDTVSYAAEFNFFATVVELAEGFPATDAVCIADRVFSDLTDTQRSQRAHFQNRRLLDLAATACGASSER